MLFYLTFDDFLAGTGWLADDRRSFLSIENHLGRYAGFLQRLDFMYSHGLSLGIIDEFIRSVGLL